MKEKVGNLTKISEEYIFTAGNRKRKFVNCLCICGNSHRVDYYHWIKEKIRSCGCLKYKCLIGNSYGRLNVLAETNRTRINSTGEKYWKCKCICGNLVEIATTDLTKKNGTRSCGCLRKNRDFNKIRLLRIFSKKKSEARRRGIEFNLNIDDIKNIIDHPCFYCSKYNFNKMKLYDRENGEAVYIEYMGIDRKNSSLPYTLENSVPCCFKCNTIKNRMTFKDYLEKMKEKI